MLSPSLVSLMTRLPDREIAEIQFPTQFRAHSYSLYRYRANSLVALTNSRNNYAKSSCGSEISREGASRGSTEINNMRPGLIIDIIDLEFRYQSSETMWEAKSVSTRLLAPYTQAYTNIGAIHAYEYAYTHVETQSMQMSICMLMHMPIHMHVRMPIHMSIHMSMHMPIHMSIHMYVHMYTHA